MASNKNTNNTDLEAGGFRTATFGFDKNDVTKYITALRKRMKSMEEEYEQKLAKAAENPTVSGDVLMREREAIRSEMEKQWNEKLLEHTSVINNQQTQISELERKLTESNRTIESLKAQLSFSTSASPSSTSSDADAKAEEAYMRFTSELRSISDSVQRTLASIEQLWNGELGVSETFHDIAPTADFLPTPKPAASEESEFDSLLTSVAEDSFASLFSDINDINIVEAPAKSEPAPVKTELHDEFASLLDDGDTNIAANSVDSFEVMPSYGAKGEDLNTDMLSDIVIAPGEEHNGGDLGKMLKEKEEIEFDAFKDLFVSESAPEMVSANISELSVTPIAEADFKPGIGTEFDLKVDENPDIKGFENFLIGEEDLKKEVKVKAEPVSEPADKNDKNKEEDLFDFSFLIADDNDDDMSSSVSDF